MRFFGVFALSALSNFRVDSSVIVDPDIHVDPAADGPSSIVGGSVAAGSIPYVVNLGQRGFDHFCGASLIASQVVLTAAHCVTDDNGDLDLDEPFVEFNRFDLNNDFGVATVTLDNSTDTFVVHPDYDSFTLDTDFALIFLPIAIDSITPVKLNGDPDIPRFNGQPLYVAGWGLNETRGQGSDQLKQLDYIYIDNDECESRNYTDVITPNMMCAVGLDDGICQGDSGGPVVIGTYAGGPSEDPPLQVGIVSFTGPTCADTQNFPDGYARISSQIDWIREYVCARTGEMCFPTGSPTFQSTPAVTV